MNLALEKQKINLADVIKNSGVELSDRGQRPTGRCPFHGDRAPSFFVYPDGYHCFGCGAHGDVIDFVQRRYDLDFKGALRFLGIETGDNEDFDDSELIKELERKKKEKQERLQRKRDILHTLSLLIRTTEKAKERLTPENFDQYAEILDPLPLWEHCHETLIHGTDTEKTQCLSALENMPTVSRHYLFQENFNFRGWLREFLNGEPNHEQQRIRISFDGT